MAEAHTDDYEEELEKEEDEPEDSSFQEYMNAFSKKDAVLEPGVIKVLEEYLDLGGNVEHGKRALARSYVGMPHVINMLMDWLHLTGHKRKEIHATVENHLKSLVVKHFDPKKADLIFTEEGSTPSWLEEMIGFPIWREVFCQLSEQYPDCLMLKFTIKLISDAGYQGEISSASSASHQPEVFAGVVKRGLVQLVSAKPTDVHKYLSEFTQMVCLSQQTYFYSQAILQSLKKHSATDNLRVWLSQEVQREAYKRKHDVTNMTLHFNGVGRHPRLFEALASMISRTALNPADISILYRHFAEDPNPPPAKYLQTPQLLELLVQSLFKPGSNINPDHKEKYLFILAYAASVYDEDGVPYKNDLEATKKAVETAHTICLRASDSHAELQVEIPTLFEFIKYPIVSLGVLRWVEYTLTDTSFFEVAAESSSLFLVLMDEIAACHRLQHPYILDLLKRLVENSYPMLEVHVQLELKKSLVDHLVQLFGCGHVLPVVDYMHWCMRMETLDQSLIRHFVSEVLSIVQPPYSKDFTSVFLPLVQDQEITGPLINSDKSDAVSMFLAECSRKSKKKKERKL